MAEGVNVFGMKHLAEVVAMRLRCSTLSKLRFASAARRGMLQREGAEQTEPIAWVPLVNAVSGYAPSVWPAFCRGYEKENPPAVSPIIVAAVLILSKTERKSGRLRPPHCAAALRAGRVRG